MSFDRAGSTAGYNEFEEETLSMGVNLNDLVRITFLEQSARYFGVYYNQDNQKSSHQALLLN